MAFVYSRTVRFQDTDAAGVVYFAQVLAMCHEAYEAALAASDIDLKTFFGQTEVALPIVHASVDFFKPMFCGDRLDIHLTVHNWHENKFTVHYQIFSADGAEKPLSKAITRHACINPRLRSRCHLPDFMQKWLADYAEHDLTVPSPVDG
ncbi:MAG: thioesterase family protein [Leptolyngbyaceae cyanobacterium bins.302]|nr:thioesterase family protein [Leptolyngbyaceae cyanobacterium bins.302]